MIKIKTFWTGILTIGYGLYQLFVENNPEFAIPTISGGMAMIFIKDAIRKQK